jgi:hypothetical protein
MDLALDRRSELMLAQASASPEQQQQQQQQQTLTVLDKSTFVLLEHININVPDHTYIVPFYYHVLGMGIDQRRAHNLGTGKGTLWANCGASQFHLPFGETAQVVPGLIGLRYDSLEPLKQRLAKFDDPAATDIKPFREYTIETDPRGDDMLRIRIMDFYGNTFLCRQAISSQQPFQDICSDQPCIRSHDISSSTSSHTQEEKIQPLPISIDTPECKGIDFLEIYVPEGTADKIAEFYDCVFDANVSVMNQVLSTPTENGITIKIAIVAFGNIDSDGRSSQSLIFREISHQDPEFDNKIRPYDGYHIALYVGTNAADFDQAFRNCKDADIVWVNPRFQDKALTLDGAQFYKQFRFKNILDLETGQVIFELEHEVRSIEHEAWPGTVLK